LAPEPLDAQPESVADRHDWAEELSKLNSMLDEKCWSADVDADLL
jgi:hypothetical protein